MAVWWTAFGAMLIPLAIVIRLEQGETSLVVYAFWIIGFVAMGTGWVYTWREMIQGKKERKIFAELLLSILSTLGGIQKELKELRGDFNDRRNNK